MQLWINIMKPLYRVILVFIAVSLLFVLMTNIFVLDAPSSWSIVFAWPNIIFWSFVIGISKDTSVLYRNTPILAIQLFYIIYSVGIAFLLFARVIQVDPINIKAVALGCIAVVFNLVVVIVLAKLRSRIVHAQK